MAPNVDDVPMEGIETPEASDESGTATESPKLTPISSVSEAANNQDHEMMQEDKDAINKNDKIDDLFLSDDDSLDGESDFLKKILPRSKSIKPNLLKWGLNSEEDFITGESSNVDIYAAGPSGLSRKKTSAFSTPNDMKDEFSSDDDLNISVSSKIGIKQQSSVTKNIKRSLDEVMKSSNINEKRVKLDDDNDEEKDDADMEADEQEEEENEEEIDQLGPDALLNNFDGPLTTRRVIRHIYRNSDLAIKTRLATASEQQRRWRLEEKEREFQQKIAPTISNLSKRLILDFDPGTKKVLVEVAPEFVEKMKDHQISGVKFMFDASIESIKRLERTEEEQANDIKSGASNGGILAHCMGLGKTFQVVVFVDTILSNAVLSKKIKTVLIMVPLNVSTNWESEFDKWYELCGLGRKYNFFEMASVKTVPARKARLEKWKKVGGAMIITSGLLAELIMGKNKAEAVTNDFRKLLIDPGADVVIIDEGHMLKNSESRLNKVCSLMKTSRRLILTGTPIQNNLIEYFVMVSFVKPNLLGSKEEFRNRFENPIKNGQWIDSTSFDVLVMKQRYFVLHKFLDDCIHRRDYTFLTPYLPPKCEYVLHVKLSKAQEELYQYYLDTYCFGRAAEHTMGIKNSAHKELFLHFRILSLIWNHPALLVDYFKTCRKRIKEARENGDEPSTDSSDEDDNLDPETKNNRNKRKLILNKVRLLLTDDWPSQFLPADAESLYSPELGPKYKLLLQILEICEKEKDKLLVFSQNLDVLDFIERLLGGKTKADGRGQTVKAWVKNEDYFRIDGKVSLSARTAIVKKINDENNLEARLLLVSTKAGGIGINLVGANRAIIFDACWNPAHDVQAVYRIFRYGQTKPVFVYRFASSRTMESKIYKRQITKNSLALRVVDAHHIDRYYKEKDLHELYDLEPKGKKKMLPAPPRDKIFSRVWPKYRDLVVDWHEHDSLLENRPEQSLTDEERNKAWQDYEKEKEKDLDAADKLSRSRNAPTANAPSNMPSTSAALAGETSGYNAALAQPNRLQEFLRQQQLNNERLAGKSAKQASTSTTIPKQTTPWFWTNKLAESEDVKPDVKNIKLDIKPKVEMKAEKPPVFDSEMVVASTVEVSTVKVESQAGSTVDQDHNYSVGLPQQTMTTHEKEVASKDSGEKALTAVFDGIFLGILNQALHCSQAFVTMFKRVITEKGDAFINSKELLNMVEDFLAQKDAELLSMKENEENVDLINLRTEIEKMKNIREVIKSKIGTFVENPMINSGPAIECITLEEEDNV